MCYETKLVSHNYCKPFVCSKSNLNDGHRRGSGNFKNSMASFVGSKMTSLGEFLVRCLISEYC